MGQALEGWAQPWMGTCVDRVWHFMVPTRLPYL